MMREVFLLHFMLVTCLSSMSANAQFNTPPNMPPLSGYGMLPQDFLVIGELYKFCGSDKDCIRAAWVTAEVGRCRKDRDAACFGSAGEIAGAVKTVIETLPHKPVLFDNSNHDFGVGGEWRQ